MQQSVLKPFSTFSMFEKNREILKCINAQLIYMFKFKSNHYKKCNQHWLAKQKEASVQFSSVQSLSRVQLFATPWTAARQASLSITNSWSLLKFMSIELVMPSNHLILCCPLLFPPSIFPSIRVFSNESVLPIRWPKY